MSLPLGLYLAIFGLNALAMVLWLVRFTQHDPTLGEVLFFLLNTGLAVVYGVLAVTHARTRRGPPNDGDMP